MLLLDAGGFWDNFHVFWPVVWLFIGASVAIAIEFGAEDKRKALPAVFIATMIGLVGALLAVIFSWPEGTLSPDNADFLNNAFALVSEPIDTVGADGDVEKKRFLLAEFQHRGGIVKDAFGSFMMVIVLIGAMLACFTSYNVIDQLRIGAADFFALILVSVMGMLLLIVANDLIMLFLAVELMSLAIYVLAGMNRRSGRSAEAALKYFVMGAFASGFLLLGMALIYGATGELQLVEIANALANENNQLAELALLGAGFLIIGFAFKVGAVPFHQWVPDVYTGSPTPVTSFMAVAVKTAAFAAFARLIVMAIPDNSMIEEHAIQGLWILAAVTIVIGNWLAVTQENVKRMLAYSSVAHSGYLMMGLVATASMTDAGVAFHGSAAITFYLLVYVFGTAGSFALLNYVSGERDGDTVRDLKGLGWREPSMGLAMAIFMFSLAGIPLTGGFLGKFWLFKSTVDSGYVALAVIGVLGSVIGAYYYLRVVVYLYMKEPSETFVPGIRGFGIQATIGIAAVATLVLGILPWNLQSHAKHGANMMERASNHSAEKAKREKAEQDRRKQEEEMRRLIEEASASRE